MQHTSIKWTHIMVPSDITMDVQLPRKPSLDGCMIMITGISTCMGVMIIVLLDSV